MRAAKVCDAEWRQAVRQARVERLVDDCAGVLMAGLARGLAWSSVALGGALLMGLAVQALHL